MIYKLPTTNWHMVLADAIEESSDGDTIVVHSDAMKELALSAHDRMCPNKKITDEICNGWTELANDALAEESEDDDDEDEESE
jgi:hypothetical protein